MSKTFLLFYYLIGVNRWALGTNAIEMCAPSCVNNVKGTLLCQFILNADHSKAWDVVIHFLRAFVGSDLHPHRYTADTCLDLPALPCERADSRTGHA